MNKVNDVFRTQYLSQSESRFTTVTNHTLNTDCIQIATPIVFPIDPNQSIRVPLSQTVFCAVTQVIALNMTHISIICLKYLIHSIVYLKSK